MIITPSRKHAVCYKLAVDAYLRKRGCGFRSCVAFTGTIELDGVKFTEEIMNKEFMENGVPYDIKSIIRNNDDLRIVIVADKLQTGFDENKLCVMYIDKKLGSGVKAVQTISRLNRPAKNKRTFVMDFVNNTEEIKAFFTQYYGGELYLPTENETDPNVLFSKRDHILDYCVITMLDVKNIHELISSEEENSGALTSLLASIMRNYKTLDDDKKKLFLAELKKFAKLFYYISAVYNSWNPEMEQVAVVFSVVYNVLYEPDNTENIDAAELVELVDFSTKVAQEELTIELAAEDQAFDGISTDVAASDKTLALIDDIIEKFNLRYAGAEAEVENLVTVLSSDETLHANVRDSSPSAYEAVIEERLASQIMDGMFESVMEGDTERAEFFSELSENKPIKSQIIKIVIRKIKDFLLSA